MDNYFSGPVKVFHGISLPEEAIPAGYAALIDAYKLRAPFPYKMTAIGLKHRVLEKDNWQILTPRHGPKPTLAGHLEFALKNEGIDLCVIKKLFEVIDPNKIAEIITDSPTGIYTRRLWFLYERITGKKLDLPDLYMGNYIDLINRKQQYAVNGQRSPRHRVVDNLPGTPDFCPLIKRNKKIDAYLEMNLKHKAMEEASAIPEDVLSRAAAFLLLKDSRASFTIENESAPHNRIERWGRILKEAGKTPLTPDELKRLQGTVIGDNRFVKNGFREAGGFVGEHDRDTGAPLPEHISAKSDDIDSLINGMLKYIEITKGNLDPVIIAAAVSFGFVYIHPFSDGNGRIHRYLIHHILAENGYNPPGLIFPVAAAILARINEYEEVLKGYSSRILPFIKWKPADDNNVIVLNDTIDFYRYFDATPHVEFLFNCVLQTIEHDLPEEAEFLIQYDRFRNFVQDTVEMPDRLVNMLYMFLHQNGGKLSKRSKEKEFSQLSADEVRQFEVKYEQYFSAGDELI